MGGVWFPGLAANTHSSNRRFSCNNFDLHPDLQHKLFALLRNSKKQVILATHSVGIINVAENRARHSAKRVETLTAFRTRFLA